MPPRAPLTARFSSLRWLVFGLLLILGLILLTWLAVPGLLKQTLEREVLAQTGRHFIVGKVQFNPLLLKVALTDIRLMEADQRSPALSADRLDLRLAWQSLWHGAPMVSALMVTHPQLHVQRLRQGGKEQTSFSDIFEKLASVPAAKGEPMRWSVSNIQISNGVLDWDDRIVNKKFHIEAFQLGVPFLSNFPAALDLFVEPYLSAKVDGSLFELKGRLKPFSKTRDTSVALDVTRFNLTELLPFVGTILPVKVQSAQLSSHLLLNFSAQQDKPKITLTGQASLFNVAVTDRQDQALFFGKQIDLHLKEADLISQRFVVESLTLMRPEMSATLDQQGHFNWSALTLGPPPKNGPAKPEPATKNQVLLDVARLRIQDGVVHGRDLTHANAVIDLDHIALDVQHFSNAANAVPASINLDVSGDGKLTFAGTVSSAPVALAGHLSMSGLPLHTLQPYLSPVLQANLGGKLNLKTALDFRDGNLTLSTLGIDLDAMQLDGGQTGNWSLANVTADSIVVKPALHQVAVTRLTLDQFKGDLFVDSHGQLNVSQLIKQAPAAPLAVPAAPAWQIEFNQLALTNSHVNVGDRSVQPALLLNADGLDIRVDHFTNQSDQPVQVSLHSTVNKTGQFAIKGAVSPKAVQLDLDIKNFAMLPLQPYFTRFVNIAMQSGTLSTTAKLSWKRSGDFTYQGDLSLAGLSTSNKESGEDFVSWDLLTMAGIDMAMHPTESTITIGNIALNKFYARAVLSEKGQLNLKNILVAQKNPDVSVSTSGTVSAGAMPAETDKPTGPPTPAHPTRVINIGTIDLKEGVINYTDNFIKPHYSMRMTGMQGQVGALHSNLDQAAPLTLSGKIDNEAPIVISGSLNPLYSPMQLDIKMTASGVDLPKMTAYAMKYAGYPIVRGKLSLDVGYHVRDNQLHASNSLKIDELSFGEQVPGSDATELPVPFLVSLLTDADGRISLDLPIEGTLNDPEFSVVGLLAKVFFNLIGKVLTSPFTLLTHAIESLAGADAEELSTLPFDPGSDLLSETARSRLDKLSSALLQRPAANLDIMGRADPALDQPGVQRYLLEQQLVEVGLPAEFNSAPEALQRSKKIEALYKAGQFPKPRNILGLSKTLPEAEMEQLLLAQIKVSEEDLRALALRRESVAQSYLSDVGHVPIERLFLVAPKLSGEGEEAESTPTSTPTRVDFALHP